MKTLTRKRHETDRLLSGTEKSIMRQLRRLKKQERIVQRKQSRQQKKLEREAYGWAALGQ